MKLFLLGGHGRLGTAMRRLWVGHDIVAPSSQELDVFAPGLLEQALDTEKPDWVVNCIAYNNVDGAEGADKELAFKINGDLPRRIAVCAAVRSIPLVHFSTDYVFAGDRLEGYVETDEAQPVSVYGQSKLRGEQYVLQEHHGAYIVRTSRLFGPNGDSPNAKRSFIELIFDDAKKAVQILVNGSEATSPTFVDDLVHHLETHILQARPAPGIYHIVNSGSATWYEWAVEIGKVMKLPVSFVPRDWRSLRRPAARPLYSMLRSTKLPAMRPWQEALRAFIESQTWNFEPRWRDIGIEGAAVEPQPRIGEPDGAVLHMLPGGTKNPEGFGPDILDIYGFTAKGKNTFRGGHYHPKLNELFFTLSGTALWVLSDFREGSKTHGKTVGIIVGISAPENAHGLPCFTLDQGTLARVRVPAGVYHAIFPLTDERITSVAIGSTPYDKEDYRYPKPEEVPGMKQILEKFGIEIA